VIAVHLFDLRRMPPRFSRPVPVIGRFFVKQPTMLTVLTQTRPPIPDLGDALVLRQRGIGMTVVRVEDIRRRK
jgi:hypothetical protein